MTAQGTELQAAVAELLGDAQAQQVFRADPQAFKHRHGLTTSELDAVKSGDEQRLAEAGLPRQNWERPRRRRILPAAGLCAGLFLASLGIATGTASAGARLDVRADAGRAGVRADTGRLGFRHSRGGEYFAAPIARGPIRLG